MPTRAGLGGFFVVLARILLHRAHLRVPLAVLDSGGSGGSYL